MSKARDIASYGYTSTNANILINGAMSVQQRGSSAVTVNTSLEVFRADRFRFEQGGVTANNSTVEVASDGPDGFTYSTKVEAGSSVAFVANGYGSVNYRIEGQDVEQLANGTSSAKQATLSFWVKSDVTGTYSVNITKYDGVTERFHVKTYTVNAPNVWEYKTVTFDGDTAASASSWMRLYWMLGGDSGAYNATPDTWVNGSATTRGVSSQVDMLGTDGAMWQITGVKLEAGSEATPFVARPYGEELALCWRYYRQGSFCSGGCWGGGGTIAVTSQNYPVAMRVAPTTTWISGGTASNGAMDTTITGLYNTQDNTTLSQRTLFNTATNTAAGAQGCDVFGVIMSFDAEL